MWLQSQAVGIALWAAGTSRLDGMPVQSLNDVVMILGAVAVLLLLLAIAGGVIAAMKHFQVKQFQDLLFKAERKIDTLERRMFNVLNAVPVALVETDTTGKFTFANKAAHQLLGRKDSELIGLRFHAATWGIAYPDGRAIPADLMPIARTLRGQTVKGFQHLLTNHGSHDKVLVSVTSMPITNNSGEVIGSTSAMVEIESWSGEGVDDLTGLWRGHWFAAATVPFWGLDAKGTVLDVNNAALDAFEMKREEVLGKTWAQLFVEDGDFQAALDYLGDIQDPNDSGDTSVRLRLKAPGGEPAACTVTGWVVRTHEGGENGLTVMAMAAEDAVVEAPVQAAPAAPLSDDDLQELEDFRSGEKALAALGVGVWQYDPLADTIVEDAGMQALIGRETPGGPTLISEDDQVLADDAFTRLKSGAADALQLDIRVAGERWITLKGEATIEDGERRIYGIAYDSTAWKQAIAAVPVAVEPSVTEADIELARQSARDAAVAETEGAMRSTFDGELAVARDEARRAGREDALAEIAAARTGDETDDGDVYAWRSAGGTGTTETLIVREPDPAVVAENAALKAELEALKAAPAPEPVVMVEADPAVVEENAALKAELEALKAAPAPEPEIRVEADPAVVEENAALKAELEALKAAPAPEPVVVVEADPAVVEQNAVLKTQLAVLNGELEALRRAPAPEPAVRVEADPAVAAELVAVGRRLAEMEDEVAAVAAARDAIQEELDEVLARPLPAPDYSARDNEILALRAQVEAARERHDDLAQRYHVLAGTPDVEPDYSAYEAKIAELQAELAAIRDLPAPEPDHSAWATQVADLKDELHDVRDAHEVLRARYAELAATPAVQPDYSAYESRAAAANAELAKWQAAHRDLQGRVEQLTQALNQREAEGQAQLAGLQARVEQMSAALSNAQRFETVGRLTGDVAQDFAQMLQVVNGALDVMARTSDSPENLRRLAEAALAAGRRGERLTRQLQAFQSEEY